MKSWICLFFLTLGAWAQARPVIAHEPPATVPAGQPLRLIARVSAPQPLQRVTLHLTQSGSTAPVPLPMQPAGAGIYSVQVDPALFSRSPNFRYFIEAHTVDGDWAETPWYTVQVAGAGAESPAARSWRRPVLIGAGAAVVVGAGVAVAGSGSGGGGDPAPPPDIDPADRVIVRTLSDTVNSPGVVFPQERSISIDDEIGPRRLNRVRIRLEFDPLDDGAESFDVIYNGRTVISGTAQGAPFVQQVDVVGGSDSLVRIRVLSSEADDGRFAWRWNATLTYFVSP